MRYTDLGRLAKEAQSILKQGHSHYACTHNNQLSFIPQSRRNIYNMRYISTCAHIHASAMHTGPKLCPSFVSNAQDTKGYS